MFGVLPFGNDPKEETFNERRIQGTYDKWPEGTAIEDDAKELIQKMLVFKPEERITWQKFSENDIITNDEDGYDDFGATGSDEEPVEIDRENPPGLDKKPKGIEYGGEETDLRYVALGITGWRNQMEDSYTVFMNFLKDHHLFGVFDGHGGIEVAYFARENFVRVIQDLPSFKTGDYGTALEEAFIKIDQIMREDKHNKLRKYSLKNKQNPAEPGLVGCTAVVVLVTPEHIYCANVGDSRAVLSRNK